MKKSIILASVSVLALTAYVGVFYKAVGSESVRIEPEQSYSLVQPKEQEVIPVTEPVIQLVAQPIVEKKIVVSAPIEPVETVDSVLQSIGWEEGVMACLSEVRTEQPFYFTSVDMTKRFVTAIDIVGRPCSIVRGTVEAQCTRSLMLMKELAIPYELYPCRSIPPTN